MTYRDEREALQAKAEALQRELDDARRELDRLRAGDHAPPGGGPHARADETSPVPPHHGLSPEVLPQRLLPLLVPPLVALPILASALLLFVCSDRLRGPDAGRVLEVPGERWVMVSWDATVRRSAGHIVPAGTHCTVTGKFRQQGHAPVEPVVDIVCGAAPVYRWNVSSGAGYSMRQCSVWEGAAFPGGTFRYRLRCHDQGPRVGSRPQLDIDTFTRTARVWQDGVPAFQLELDIAEFSTPWAGASLFQHATMGELDFAGPVLATGRVSATTGLSATAPGQACTVWITPVRMCGFNCRVEVVCNGNTVYGAPQMGYTRCQVESGLPWRAHDPDVSERDGDPRLVLDVPSHRVVVSDAARGASQSVTITLDR